MKRSERARSHLPRGRGETLADFLPKVFREEPNVLVVRDLVDAETVAVLCREISAQRSAGDFDGAGPGTAPRRCCGSLRMGVPPADFARHVTAVALPAARAKALRQVQGALYPGAPGAPQLGIPGGRVGLSIRPPQAKPTDEDRKETCRECGGSGYLGQTALFEIVVLDDALRKTLAAGPKLDALRQAARKAGMRDFQEEGVLMVARGVTSLQELMRVLKPS